MATTKKSKWSVARTKLKATSIIASGSRQKPKLDTKKGTDKKKKINKKKGKGWSKALVNLKSVGRLKKNVSKNLIDVADLSQRETEIKKDFEKCKEMHAKYDSEHPQFERTAAYVKGKCMVLDRSLKNAKLEDLKLDDQTDESVKKIILYYRGVSRYHLGLVSAMADQHPEATAHFEQAIDFFDESLDVNYELKSVEGYLPSVQKAMLRMNSDERLEKLKRLSQVLDHSLRIAWRHLDKTVLDHNKKVVEKVMLDMSMQIDLNHQEQSKIKTNFVLYQNTMRSKTSKKLGISRAATLIEASDDVTVLLAAKPFHGEVGCIASDNIHRPAVSFQIYTPLFPSVEGRIMPSENESSDGADDKHAVDDFHAKVDRFINSIQRRAETNNESLHDGTWREFPENVKGVASFYWPDSGEKEEVTILPHEDARLGAKRLSAGHTEDKVVHMQPKEFATFAIAVEQCDALRAYLIKKRLELANIRNILNTERQLGKVREAEASLLTEIRQIKSYSELKRFQKKHMAQHVLEEEEEEDDDDIVNIEVENDAVDPGVFQFESPIKIANPLGLCASSRDDDLDTSPEITRSDNVGSGTRKQPGTGKKQEEGCHIS